MAEQKQNTPAAAFVRHLHASLGDASRGRTTPAPPGAPAFKTGPLMAGAVPAAAAAAASGAAPPAGSPAAASGSVPAMSSDGFAAAEVSAVHDLTDDSKVICLKTAPQGGGGAMPTASFVLVRAVIDGKEVMRPYTPLCSSSGTGTVLAVRGYPQGNMSKHLCGLKPGDRVDVKGPIRKIEYQPNSKKDVVMIAGGSGITPMYQVLAAIWENASDDTNVTLMYANRGPESAMLGNAVEAMFQLRGGKSRLLHFFSDDGKLPEAANARAGYITKEVLAEVLPKPSDSALVLVCGPPPMMRAISGDKAPDKSQGELAGALKELGWSESNVFKF